MALQGTDAWKMSRCGKVTASRLDAVCAKGRGKDAVSATREDYMAEIIAERLTGQPYPDGFISGEMRWGIATEPLAKKAIEIATGELLIDVGAIDHPLIPWTAASPDSLMGDGLCEIKCPKTKTHLKYLAAGVPPSDYIPQMTWQCACTGRKWCQFASFDPRLPEDLQLFMVKFVPDQILIDTYEKEVRQFLSEVEERLDALKKLPQSHRT